ncbi:MAG: STAS domain-containing protein [Bacteroidales bacterium]|jgi:anti-anti-sigma factor|nr:STAS domain-containing protein [Bacteroidales bacterium]
MIQVSVTQKENPLIIKLEGRLDALTASDCEVAIREHIKDFYTNSLYFEVANLEYISSAGLRIFLLLINEYESTDRKIGIIAPNEMVLEVFEISGIIDFVDVFESESKAISSF